MRRTTTTRWPPTRRAKRPHGRDQRLPWRAPRVALLCISLLLTAPATVTAQPPDTGSSGGPPALPAPNPPRLLDSVPLNPTRTALFVDSPAMQRVVQVQVLHPDSTAPRPSLYLLDGVDASNTESTWTEKTDVTSFFANRNVNVVLPVGGAGSYYTDWQRPDPALGINKWETFLTNELPPLIDSELHGTGANAVAGLSMGGHAALNLITRHPDLYRGVAAFSACPDSLDSNARSTVRATVASKGGDANNMWGPDDNPDWAAHDPMTNAAQLRGKTVYLAVGNGIPGPHELLRPFDEEVWEAATSGAALEWAAMTCIRDFQARLASVGARGTFDYELYGTHSWPYWQDYLHAAWPVLARALG